jgi:hypothetical protein
MKKILLILSAIAFGVSGANADVTLRTRTTSFNVFDIVPAKYTYDNKDKVLVTVDEWKNYKKSELSIYDNEFIFVKNIVADSYFMNLYNSANLTEGYAVGSGILYVTQTLFNDDDKYEYLSPTIVDGKCTGFSVVSEDGKVLSNVKFGGYTLYSTSDNDIYLLELSGNNFLVVKVQDADYVKYNLVYAIDKQNSSVKSVGAPIKTSVHPTAPARGETVNIDLSDVAAQGATVSVTSVSGKTVMSEKIAAGTNHASIDTSSLQRGVYVVTVNNGKTTRENTKIIIR